MELLAPAGSKESLVAAVEAGADAVYAGLQDFNARRKARNFSVRDIEVMADYLHRKGRKIYLTFNTLLKEGELASAFQLLNTIAALKIDGLIVQDLGLAWMARKYFPHLELHGSTQMAVHNSEGVRFLERQGFTRVILARELSLQEIRAVREATALELEVFVHGALCYSMSGLCLASSLLGGHSGNRGLCTQPCRRLVEKEGRKGFFFSTRDLEALALLKELRQAGVKSLKIEGRMKSAEYVSAVVSAYRKALDEPDGHIPPCEDYSRDKTAYYLMGRRGTLVEPDRPGVIGKYAALVQHGKPGALTVKLQRSLRTGDRLRTLQETDGGISTVNVKALYRDGAAVDSAAPGEVCEIESDTALAEGTRLYLVGTLNWDEGRLKALLDGLYGNFRRSGRSRDGLIGGGRLDGILKELAAPVPGKPEKQQEKPMVRIDDPGWLDVIREHEISEIVINGEAVFGRELPGGPLRSRLIIALPLLIPQGRVEAVRASVKGLCRKGCRKWMADNPGHLELLMDCGAEIISGPFLYTLNSMAEKSLQRHGVTRHMASFEDDYLNIRDRGRKGSRSIVTLFGHPPCLITRAPAEKLFDSHEAVSLSGEGFLVHHAADATFITAQKPVALFQHRARLKDLAGGFMLDLCWLKPSPELWQTVLTHYRECSALKGSERFNFKRGLK